MRKVNLMIAIDEENYKRIKDDVYDTHDIYRAIISIRKGTSLDNLKEIYIGMDGNAVQIYPNNDVLDKIRAEIAEYKDDKIIHAEQNGMIDIVIGIIDKYRNEVSE